MNPDFDDDKLQLEQQELERNRRLDRRLEYDEEYYDQFFKCCDNCFLMFHTRHLFYINYDETVKVCKPCLDIIMYEEITRELRRKYYNRWIYLS